MALILVVLRRILLGIVSSAQGLLTNTLVFSIDFLLTVYNLITPDKPVGSVLPKGHPGHGGQWPQYVPPSEGDSRGSCPALNAMANHGILPRNGKNISFRELNHAVQRTFNFAPTFCFFVPTYIGGLLERPYATGRFDLADLDAHNCIEHDASLTRVDSFYDADQGRVAVPLCEEVLRSGTGPGGNLTKADLSRLLGKRRVEAKRANPKYSSTFTHKMFGASNGSTLLTIFGGRVDDLRAVLLEERIPDGWEPRVRHRMGLTMVAFNLTVLPVELGIKEEVNGSIAQAGLERYAATGSEKKNA